MDAQALIQALDATGIEYRGYSGRGMYGKECVGVVVSDIGEAMRVATEIAIYAPEISYEFVQGVHVDDMGRDIILYWRRAKLTTVIEDEE